MLNRRDDQNEAKRMVLFCVAAASMVLLLFLVALYMHDSKDKQKHALNDPLEKSELSSEEEDVPVGESNIVSSDLDFWDMYDNKPKTVINEDGTDERDIYDDANSSTKRVHKSTSDDDINVTNDYGDDDSNYIENSSSSKSDRNRDDADDLSRTSRATNNEDNVNDGSRIKVKGSDGKIAWYDILEDVKKNSYDFKEYLTYDNGLLKYNAPGYRTLAGIDVSNLQGGIDFDKVKRAGIDYVILKVASRGYETGAINIDSNFIDYANGCTLVSLPIGAYITSNAITDVEAVEEANYAVAASNNYNVKYPIAIDFVTVSNDNSRTDRLTPKERTAIIRTFCDTVKQYGRTPAISASRDFLITEVDLEDLSDIDIWLKDEAVTADYMRVQHLEDNDFDDENREVMSSSESSSRDSLANSSSSRDKSKKVSNSSSASKAISTSSGDEYEDEDTPDYIGTDYPYNFTMWQYTKKGTINGIEGNVNLNLSFVNYAER